MAEFGLGVSPEELHVLLVGVIRVLSLKLGSMSQLLVVGLGLVQPAVTRWFCACRIFFRIFSNNMQALGKPFVEAAMTIHCSNQNH